jgi:hypothetical protein
MIDEDPYLHQDCQVSVRDCTARFAGDQPDELKLVESKQHSLAHTIVRGVSRRGAGIGKPQSQTTHVFCLPDLAKEVLRESSGLLTCMSIVPMEARFVRVVCC